jgi:anti-sigma B factor antagonist
VTTLNWDTERLGADLNLALQGELDIASSKRLEDELLRLEQEAPAMITLDLQGVTFIDSTGLSTLINADGRARKADRRLQIVAGSGAARRILRTVGLLERLDVIDAT